MKVKGMGVLKICIIFVLVLFAACAKNSNQKSAGQKSTTEKQTAIVEIDDVIRNPDGYKGVMGVKGTVIKVDQEKNILFLGCADACVYLPVLYQGKLPDPKSDVVVYGEIKKQENGKYIFEGIKP